MQVVVLDKSYLQGANAGELSALCADHAVLMIETLFYELLTAENGQRARCLRKLPGENAVELLPRPGPLLRYEIHNRRPAYPLADHVLPVRFSFNADAGLDADRRRHLAEWRTEVSKEQTDYPEMARGVGNWFPRLKGMRSEERSAECTKLKRELSEQDVRAVYRDIAADVFPDFPRHDLLDPTWALYRWTQARIIGSLDFVARYGFDGAAFNQKKLENHLHDMEYLTMASLAGALATRDQLLGSNFELLCPDGRWIR